MSDTMMAGRDMDAEIAQRVMGWRGPVEWVDDEDGRDPYLFRPDADDATVAANDRDWDCRVPNYTTDIDDALDVWCHMQANGVTLSVDPLLPRALAICVAALDHVT